MTQSLSSERELSYKNPEEMTMDEIKGTTGFDIQRLVL